MRLPFRKRRKPGRDLVPYHAFGGAPDEVGPRENAFKREMATLRKEQEDGLTAAGQRVLNGQATLLRRLIQPWQIRSLGYYDQLGEIKYAAQFYSRSLSNLRLYVGKRQEDGEYEEVGGVEKSGDGKTKPRATTSDDDLAIEALDRIRDPGGGGRAGLLSAFGRLMFLTGETYLFVSVNPETDMEQWEMLSTDEIRLNDGLYTRFKSPSLPARNFQPAPDDQFELVGISPGATQAQKDRGIEQMGGVYREAIAYRLWKRHPRFSDLADATMQGVLELCEELLLLTHAVRARARSRMAGSGILFIDDRITTRPLEATPDEDPLVDPFVADLTAAMTTPIVDEGTASAVVPLVARVRVPDGMKLADLVYHLQIIDPMQVYPETGLRNECIHRIAIGLDMPSDILEGLTDANHWTAWMVDEQSWKAHLQPVAQQLVEDLTSAYLAPYLKQAGVADWNNYVIAYDAAAVINHPDRGKDAKDLFDRNEISGRALREATGFDEEDAPSDEERNRYGGVKMRDPSLFLYGVPSLRQNTELEPDAGTIVSPDTGTTVSPGVNATPANEADKSAPARPDSPQQQNEDVVGALMAARVEGAAQMALLRAREAAGARLRSLARSDQEITERIDGVLNRQVAHTLGPIATRQLARNGGEQALVASGRALILDSLRMVGVKDEQAAVLTDAISAYAVKTLYEAQPALNGSFPEFVKGVLSGSS